MSDLPSIHRADVVIVGGTPGGIAAAVAAARLGRSVILLDRTTNIGGLVANGLGATDIETRGATGGFFMEFTRRIRACYAKTYGEDSQQVIDSSDGYHFEPSVAEKVLETILSEYPKIIARKEMQFDSFPENVTLSGTLITEIRILNRVTSETERFAARVFIDATYEGDLAAAAGAPYRLGREDQREFNEPMAGQIYKTWNGDIGAGTTGRGDNAIQSYNYRLPLTKVAENRVPITQPAGYNREEYASLVDDVKLDRHAGRYDLPHAEYFWDGIGKIVNIVHVPNGKTDSNNQHKSFISTDLPEENWPWPTASWEWRDAYSLRLRRYIEGLLWFAQNDPELPADFRAKCSEWGYCKDEYLDNGHFPRQVYVREGRRIMGEHLFTGLDALPTTPGGRPPIYADAITTSHYALDSHPVRKRETGRVHLEGMLSKRAEPYTVPYGTIVPKDVDGLLVPVAASCTHIGFSTLRMEPCWMALGEAAGAAASLSISEEVDVRDLEVTGLQRELLRNGAVLYYFKDVHADEAVQMLGLRGLLPEWKANLDVPVSTAEAKRWTEALLVPGGAQPPLNQTRGEYLRSLWELSNSDAELDHKLEMSLK
ncbi:MAG TPA: FAD-dependent oxidoreductase [Candidatus Methylacidiphilales bacterium]|nr:FAD-dependent oxidoreductase [Candidatus Methylacidiphilales bacterium]